MPEEALKEEVFEDGFEDITGNFEEPEPEPEPEPSQEETADDPVEQDSDQDPEPEGSDQEEETETVEETVEEAFEETPIAEPADETGDELAALREQNEALLKHIEQLSGHVIGSVPPPVDEKAPEPSEQAKTPDPAPSQEVMNFLENTTIDDILEDPTQFNSVLNNVVNRSSQTATQAAVQQVMRSVPELVMGYITRHTAMNKMVDDFYREHPDLADVKQTVAAVANDIHAKSPDLEVDEVFKQSAEQTRKLLGLKKEALKTTKPKKPAFARASSTRKSAPPVDPVQSEINDLLSGDF